MTLNEATTPKTVMRSFISSVVFKCSDDIKASESTLKKVMMSKIVTISNEVKISKSTLPLNSVIISKTLMTNVVISDRKRSS
jgi:hypothetical protein